MRLCDLIRFGWFSCVMFMTVTTAVSQSRAYPDKIRGYKVERTVVEVKKPDDKAERNSGVRDVRTGGETATVDQLISFGKPSLARATPLGMTFEVPIVVAPVTQNGKVDFLVFEDIEINGRSVEISEYNHSFKLPNSAPLTLKAPLRIYIYLPGAVLAAIDEWTESKIGRASCRERV